MTKPSIRVGVSTCLLGENVRYDGGHKKDHFLTDVLNHWVEYVPVCPEVEMGMGTPRPPIQLVHDGNEVQLVAPSSGENFTDRMRTYSEQRVTELQSIDLDGYVLKRGSPSCGMAGIAVHKDGIEVHRNNSGIFAETLMSRWPGLPVEEEGRLNDADLRENFIERIVCRHRWRLLTQEGMTRGKLVQFHTVHKMLLLAHNQASYRRLGKIVAAGKQIQDSALFAQYEEEFQNCLRHKTSTKNHVNVLMHAMGYFKKRLTSAEKEKILGVIKDFQQGIVPLSVPIEVFRTQIRRFDIEYLSEQLYFEPHPEELFAKELS